jgi:hypothetical protein
MRKFTILLLVIISLFGIKNSKAQIAHWSPLKRITAGYKDSNPDFGSMQNIFMNLYAWEFLIFQRQIDTASQICVIKMSKDGPLDNPQYLSSNNYKKRNPCIAYTPTAGDTIRAAFALWESNQNGRWDIYGAYYSYPSGWTQAFPVDSGAGNKFNPKAIMYSDSEFGIVYSRDDDIIYRRYNAPFRTVISEVNQTSAITAQCKNPFIAYPNTNIIRISFQSLKPDNTWCLYRIGSNNGGGIWSSADTFAYAGNNSLTQLGRSASFDAANIFESNKSGKNAIYEFTSNGPASTVLSSPYFNYSGFKNYFYPIITDYLVTNTSAVIRKSNDSIKIIFDPIIFDIVRDSTTIGDTTKKTVLAMNAGIRNSQGIFISAVFNMDTASYTSLYYRSRIITVSDIKSTSNTVAKEYELYQNYPNPFNPTTKIKFDIPKLSDVKIIVFDAVGREVKNITQNNLTAGSYEYEFSGENLSSGIYYFKLQTNEFSKSIKMALVK